MLLLAIAALGISPAVLSSASSATLYTDVFTMFMVYILAVVGGGTWLTRRYGGNEQLLIDERNNKLSHIVANHNEQVNTLVELFEEDRDGKNTDNSLEALRQRVIEGGSTKKRSRLSNRELNKIYSKRYDQCHKTYQREIHSYLSNWKQQNKEKLVFRHFWGWLIAIGFLAAIFNFGYSMVVSMPDTPSSAASSLASSQEVTYWNAENIPIPYLQDSTQYVSNPDHVLTQEAVDQVNVTMKRVEQDFDIQSVIIVVNHIENDDPYRFAQDVGNRYGVGRNDRGLVVVVGYEDHSINMSPGRSLEADLTDAECHRLEQEYVVPAMRAEMPDSAMIYLAEAIYAKLQQKEMPQMALFSSNDTGNDIMGTGLYTCFMLVWLIFFVYKNKKYQWLGVPLAAQLLSNPFYVPESNGGFYVGGGGGGGFGGGGGGGGFGGGSFGGGSFGGGGATSRW